MLEELKKEVFEANIFLKENDLVCLTWGNASGIDRKSGLVVIKPSGVPYETMKAEDMVVVDMDGNVIEGKLRPSSDLPTHLELYKNFPQVKGIVHTHSRWATIFAQCRESIPALGTTHADTFYGDVPCTRLMTDEEIKEDYERNTGKVIVETFADKNPMDIPAVIIASHGPFTWGKNAMDAAKNSVVLEEVAMMAWHTCKMKEGCSLQKALADKHYFRKHGTNAYYGQGEEK